EKVTDIPDTPATREFGPAERAELVKEAGLDGNFLRRHANVPQTEFRAAVMDAIERRQERTATSPMVYIVGYGEEQDAPLARALGEALFARVTPGHALSAGAKPYANMPLAEMARLCL